MNRIGEEPPTNDVRGSPDEDPLGAIAGDESGAKLVKDAPATPKGDGASSGPTQLGLDTDQKIGRSSSFDTAGNEADAYNYKGATLSDI